MNNPNIVQTKIPPSVDNDAVMTLVLFCPRFVRSNELVEEVTKNALIDLLLNLQDLDVPVDDKWYYSLVSDVCYDPEGDFVRVFTNSQEQENFEREPWSVLTEARYQVRRNLNSIISLNKENIQQLYSTSPKELRVIKTLDNHLIMMIKGY